MEMDELLLIFNGKFDWKVLLVFDFSIFVSDWGLRILQEEILCDLFVEVFGLVCVGIDDSFFELGGYLFFVVCLMSCICEVMGVEFGIVKFFDELIVVGFVVYFDQVQSVCFVLQRVEWFERILFFFVQCWLWFFYCFEGFSFIYNILVVVCLLGELD